ncbi:germinal center-associated signaling and motility protein [Antechinus flavipes]|uniref:germinal center-associated signaling and motility protein n=1 Tax=Antechinus flavipes TaxID=38775 RepID=UPI00223635B4|nr:germinal center-associated signaling and motility protein [Antechinus flavipes]
MKKGVKQGAGLKNPNERMGNCLQRIFRWPKDTQEEHGKSRIRNSKQKKFRQKMERRKKKFHKEREEVSLAYHKKNHEGNAKEPFYALIVHLPQRMPSTNSTENDYENVGPKYKKPKPPDHKHETEYAVLKVPSRPQPSHSLHDEEYELVMPVTHDSYP